MLNYIRDSFVSFYEDTAYYLQRAGAYMLGKNAIVGGSEAAGTTIAAVTGVSGALGSSMAGVMTVSLAGGLSAALTQVDHLHRRKLLLEEYRDEIAAKLGRDTKQVGEKELYLLAEGDKKQNVAGNAVLKEALDNSRKRRNIDVFVSAAASVAAFGVTMAIFGGSGADTIKELGHAVSSGAVGEALGHFGHLAIKSLVGLASYLVVKTPMHWVAGHLFDLEKATVNDRIVEVKRKHGHGKAISLEDMFTVVLEGRPDLEKAIEHQFGKPFEQLEAREKILVLEDAKQQFPLQQWANDINANRMKPEELAFATIGQRSGVVPHANEKLNMFGAWLERIVNLVNHRKLVSAEVPASSAPSAEPQGIVQVATEHSAPDAPVQHEAVNIQGEVNAPGQHASFVQRVSRSSTAGMGHVERLEQARAESAVVQLG